MVFGMYDFKVQYISVWTMIQANGLSESIDDNAMVLSYDILAVLC